MTRIGIIGYGNMGQWMAGAFRDIEGVRVAGVAETAPANAQAARERGIPCYADVHQLLEQPLDGVYIASPNALHREHVLACAARGLPILCEKPVAISLEDADDMVRAVEAAGVLALVNFVYCFTDAYERLRAYYVGGQLGRLLACWFRTFRGYGFYAAGARHPAVTQPELSGGWPVHHGIHAVDWLLSIGGPVTGVAARTFRSTPDAPSAEGLFGLLYFAFGAVGEVSDAVLALRDHPAGIVGSAGTATYDRTGMVRLCRETGHADAGEEIAVEASITGYQHTVARHFVAVVRGEEAPRTTLSDGRYALQVVLALLEADRTNGVVAL